MRHKWNIGRLNIEMFDEYKNGLVKILSILPALDYKTCTEFGITVHVVVFSFLRWSFAFSIK